jgi:RNA polymerase sigma-70 factor (ECF subfamily)
MAEIPATRASLLARLRDPRDEAAWSQFVDLYGPLVYGYARKQGLQDADAADLSQDVLLAVAGAVGQLEYDPCRGSFRNWLFTVVRRKLANRRRDRKIRRADNPGPGGQVLLERCPAPEEEAEWESEWKQHLFAWACQEVRRAVSEATWQAFWRTAVLGQTGKEVAEQLGLSVPAVYHARSRLLARLRELVALVPEP